MRSHRPTLQYHRLLSLPLSTLQNLKGWPVVEDVTYSSHRTLRNIVAIDLEASSVPASFHGAGKCCACCPKRKHQPDSSVESMSYNLHGKIYQLVRLWHKCHGGNQLFHLGFKFWSTRWNSYLYSGPRTCS